MLLIHLLLSVATASAGPGPLDSYKLNQRETKAKLNFSFKQYRISEHPFLSRKLPIPGTLRFAGSPRLDFSGKWESDGSTEHITMHREDSSKSKDMGGELPDFECLFDFDNKVFAWHDFHDKEEAILLERSEKPRFNLFGPTDWMQTPFLSMLKTEYDQATVERTKGVYDGAAVICETYTVNQQSHMLYLLVAYDSSINYVPRYIRGISQRKGVAKPTSHCKEIFVVEAKPCSAGGFVPTEWVELAYSTPNFDAGKASSIDANLAADSIKLSHFTSSNFEDFKEKAVGLNDISRVRYVLATKVSVPIPAATKQIGLEFLLSQLSRNAMVGEPLPDLVQAASSSPMHFSVFGYTFHISHNYLQGAFVFLGFIICFLVGLRLWGYNSRKYARVGVIVMAGLITQPVGCGKPSDGSLTPLELATEHPFYLYDIEHKEVYLNVILTNRNIFEVNILTVDGGCSCRKFEANQFPIRLAANSRSKLKMTYMPKQQTEKQSVFVGFLLPSGKISLPLDIAAFPKHLLNPDSIALTWNTKSGDTSTFEITHRECTPVEQDFTSSVLKS